jgi:hypothetical protein
MIDFVIICYEFVITSMIGMYNYVVFYWISQTLGQVSFSIILEHMPFDTKNTSRGFEHLKIPYLRFLACP